MLKTDHFLTLRWSLLDQIYFLCSNHCFFCWFLGCQFWSLFDRTGGLTFFCASSEKSLHLCFKVSFIVTNFIISGSSIFGNYWFYSMHCRLLNNSSFDNLFLLLWSNRFGRLLSYYCLFFRSSNWNRFFDCSHCFHSCFRFRSFFSRFGYIILFNIYFYLLFAIGLNLRVQKCLISWNRIFIFLLDCLVVFLLILVKTHLKFRSKSLEVADARMEGI